MGLPEPRRCPPAGGAPVRNKRQTHKQRLLALLSDGQPHHMSECIREGGYRYGGRIHELRHDDGYRIETIALADDEFAYRLIPDGQLALI